MDVAEAVPDAGFHAWLVELPDRRERPFAAVDGLLVVPDKRMTVSDVVQRHRLKHPVARRLTQVVSLLEMVQCLVLQLPALGQPAKPRVNRRAVHQMAAEPLK